MREDGDMGTRTVTREERLFQAMLYREEVCLPDGTHGYIDEMYRSVTREGNIRCRVADPSGRVHHHDVNDMAVALKSHAERHAAA